MTMAFWGKRVALVPYFRAEHIPHIYVKDVEFRYPKEIRKEEIYSVQAEGIGHIGFVADTTRGAMGEANVGPNFYTLPVPQLRLIDAIRLVVEKYDAMVREHYPNSKKDHLRSGSVFGKEQRKAMAEFFRNALADTSRGTDKSDIYAAMYLAADMLEQDDPKGFSRTTFTNYVHTGDATFEIK